jgi:hypothetical protein
VKQKPSWEAKPIALRAVDCISVVVEACPVEGICKNSVRKETI